MNQNLNSYKKANRLSEVDNAVRFDVPIAPGHEFYTDFSDVRGDFEDRMIYKTLNVHPKTFVFNHQEVVRDFPDYQAFKGNYEWAKNALSDLEE